jgi:hypothetical protein
MPDSGMPQDRLAQLAAHHSFVELKAGFIAAVGELRTPQAVTLLEQVIRTREPVELWLLRGPVFAALRSEARQLTETRLHLQLGRVFADDVPVYASR